MADNAKRVAKNTLALYFRMFFLTLVSLFTVRVALNAFGVEDYGLYNVVGGFVGLFGFFSGSLTNAAQRFFAISLATQDWEKLNKALSLILGIILVFSVVVLLICETVGIWVITTKMTIPVGRMTAALLVYEFSIVSFILVILGAPISALLVADENLSVYAFVSVAEGICKLLIAYALIIASFDKLILYAGLLFVLTVTVQGFYLWYCLNKYPKLKVRFYREPSEYKEIFGYIHWDLIGALAHILKGQGINIIMNIFFGPTINAARGIAYNVNNAIASFSQNFMKAVDPQIMKAYALEERDRFKFLLILASKMSYFLLFAVALPLMLNIDYVLKVWLNNPPQYTGVFVLLALADALLSALTDPLCTAVHAVGDLKIYQILVGGASLMNVPVAYGLLLYFHEPWIPFGVGIAISFIMGLLRIYTFRRVYAFSGRNYFFKVYIPVGLVTLISVEIGRIFFSHADTFLRLLGNSLGILIFISALIMLVGLNTYERLIMGRILPLEQIRNILGRFKGEKE